MRSVGLLCIAMLFFGSSVYAERTVWYIHPDSALNTIQAGLDSCADYDIVLVGPGIYYENIVWPNTQGIHLVSELGAASTTIDGSNVGDVISINFNVDSNTVIRNFTVQNGDGGGVVVQAGLPTIAENVIRDNTRGIYIIYTAYGCIINNNSITNNATGIIIWFSSATVSGNFIADNIDWGILFSQVPDENMPTQESPLDNRSIIISDNTIINNGRHGVSTWDATMRSNTIANNGWGGVVCGGTCAIDSCAIFGNNGDGVLANYGDIHYCDIYDNIGYGVKAYGADTVFAEHNWWGDASGPYHSTANPGGSGDSVSDYVDFDPWLSWPVGVKEQPIVKPIEQQGSLSATIFRGPLQLPAGKQCRVFDITGRVVEPDKIAPGIYFLEIDDKIVQKVIKIR